VLLKEDNKLEEMELELGTLLKKAREEKGLSLDDIQEETKIRKKYLEAIEENNFEILPGNVYLKVFIKGYAREVGINYQALLENYEILNIKEEKESNLQKDYLNGTKVSSGSKNKERKNPLKIIFIILLILFLGAAAVYTYQYINSSEIRLLNQQSSQEENIEENSELLAVEENSSEEASAENEGESNDSEESETNNSTNNSEIDLNSLTDEDDNINLMDSFDSSEVTEENTEIIDQNNFNETEGPDSQEQNQLSEIIISEDLNQQQESEENADEEDADTAVQPTSQSDNVELNASSDQQEEEPALEELNSADEEAGMVNDTVNEAEESANQEEAVLDNNIEILASDTVWVTVDVDGANAFSGILEAGDQQQFEVEDRLYIKIGNGSAITAAVGGENYGPWAGNGEIAEVEFLNEDEQITINNLRN
jgi:cytoskeletal protein RodZ